MVAPRRNWAFPNAYQQAIMSNTLKVPGFETFSHTDPEIPNYVPSDNMSTAAWKLCFDSLPITILNHSLRVFLIARCLEATSDDPTLHQPLQLQQPPNSPIHSANLDPSNSRQGAEASPRGSLLFIACMFHDLGTVCYTSDSARFEIESADAALRFLDSYSTVTPEHKREVWQAIALHSTPQIPERMGGLVELVRQAVRIDFRSDGAFEGCEYRRGLG